MLEGFLRLFWLRLMFILHVGTCCVWGPVGDLGFELCMFVAGWRHTLRSEWPFIIIISSMVGVVLSSPVVLVSFPCALLVKFGRRFAP